MPCRRDGALPHIDVCVGCRLPVFGDKELLPTNRVVDIAVLDRVGGLYEKFWSLYATAGDQQ